MIDTRRLGQGDVRVGAIALGAMAFAGWYGSSDDDAGVRAIQRAIDLVPLVGMGRPENVDRNLEAVRVQLDDADKTALDAAFPIGCAAGLRYPEAAMASLGREAPTRRAPPGT